MPRGVYNRNPRPRTQDARTEDTSTDLFVSREGGAKPLKVCIWPSFRGEDNGDGGVRRVVEGQVKHLPKFGIELVNTPEEADVIACHIEMPTPWYKLYPDKPVVAHCHGLYWSDFIWETWALEANAKVMNLLRSADAITVPSEWVANAVRRNTSRHVNVIPHGVDADEWKTDEEPMGYVLWNKTRPDPVCDPEPMVAVAKILPDVEFVSTFGVDDLPNLTLTGRIPFETAKRVVQRAGVYLCTAKETFGIGTLEAMAAGVPVVGFNWGGQVDIVRHTVDGFLVPPNDVHNLAMAIKGALQDRALMSPNAIARAAEFTWEKAAEQYAELYREVYSDKTRRQVRSSIIVTAYNLGKYLPDTLQSVLEQTDTDWECVVVDDASPDNCGKIADDFASKDPRFKVIHNERNVYLAEARNIGIRKAQGRYILPLDADDMLAPDAVKTLADALDTDRTIHVAYGGVFFVDEDGETPTVYDPRKPGLSGWPLPFKYEHQIIQRNLLPYSSMYRKTAWEQTGGYRPRCRTAEDADMWTRFASYGFTPKMVTDKPTLIYRNREGSMSREQGTVDWIKWFPWAKDPKITPAGACTEKQVPVPSFDRTAIATITPVGPHHLTLVKDAVDSVDAQFFRDWECIVINDTIDPLPELPAWVRVLNNPGAGGVAQARNWGIQNTKSPLFLPLDADDYLQPNALQWMMEAFLQTKDIIYTDFWEDPQEEGVLSVYNLKDYDANNLKRGTLHCVTALTPKSAWEKVGGYDESLPAWEDWDFQLKVADAGICSRLLAAPLWVYRKHTGQRREANVKDFEVSKNGILSKWSDIWDGRKTLAACSTCGAKASIRPAQPRALTPEEQATRLGAGSDDAVFVTYTGNKEGNMPFKGKSGTFYKFSARSPSSYVLRQDAVVFQGRPDFKITDRPEPLATTIAKAPILVAEGNPN